MSAWQKMKGTGEQTALYELLAEQLAALIADENDPIANMANMSALLYRSLDEINWAGFYRMMDGMLVLGPFQGNPACIRIPMGRGVCGTAAKERKTQLVPDVHLFPGHIACDAQSRSEIVIPLLKEGVLLGVLDIDSPVKERFDAVDQSGLEKLAEILSVGCNWN